MVVARVVNENGDVLKTRKNTTGLYNSVGEAKAAARTHVRASNKRRQKPDKKHCEDYHVQEYELIPIEEHPI
jgi:hypothetical protein